MATPPKPPAPRREPRAGRERSPAAPAAGAIDPADGALMDAFLRETGAPGAPPGDGGEPEGGPLREDGHDGATHNGARLEAVEGFDPTRAMTEGVGFAEAVPLREARLHLPSAGRLHYDPPPVPSAPPWGGPRAAPEADGAAPGVAMETVCGMDDRVRVRTTAAPPWRMICQLVITMGDGLRSRGTGWFASPRTVITAGHCVHSRRHGGWVRSVEVIPGMDGTLRPFGAATATRFHSVAGWTEHARPQDDVGCIVLPEDAPLGARTGWFGFAAPPDAELERLLLNNAGYAGDQAFGTQWYNAGRVTQVRPERLTYMLDTFGGQSGSPTWRRDAATGARHAVGIHAYGGCPNRSTRITPALFGLLRRWKAMGA